MPKKIHDMLKKISQVISETYQLDKEDIMIIIKDITRSFQCTYILGNGSTCDSINCPYHNELEEIVNKSGKYGSIETLFTREQSKSELSEEEEEDNNVLKQMFSGEQSRSELLKEDNNIVSAINESIMYNNINQYKKEYGINLLKKEG